MPELHPIDTAPKAPLDFLKHGPTVLVYRDESDAPVTAWWEDRKQHWRDAVGPLPYMPKFWSA